MELCRQGFLMEVSLPFTFGFAVRQDAILLL